MRRGSWIACSCCHQALSQVPGYLQLSFLKNEPPKSLQPLSYTYVHKLIHCSSRAHRHTSLCQPAKQQNICSDCTIKIPTHRECRTGRPFPLMMVGNELSRNAWLNLLLPIKSTFPSPMGTSLLPHAPRKPEVPAGMYHPMYYLKSCCLEKEVLS